MYQVGWVLCTRVKIFLMVVVHLPLLLEPLFLARLYPGAWPGGPCEWDFWLGASIWVWPVAGRNKGPGVRWRFYSCSSLPARHCRLAVCFCCRLQLLAGSLSTPKHSGSREAKLPTFQVTRQCTIRGCFPYTYFFPALLIALLLNFA